LGKSLPPESEQNEWEKKVSIYLKPVSTSSTSSYSEPAEAPESNDKLEEILREVKGLRETNTKLLAALFTLHPELNQETASRQGN
jgi:hypothetical protein